MSTIKPHLEAIRKGSSDALYRAMSIVDQQLDIFVARTGGFGFVETPNPNPQSSLRTIPSLVPPADQFVVTGVDGKFIIAIANPENILPESVAILQAQAIVGANAGVDDIWHNLQSCSTLNFDLAGGLADYGISAQLGYTFVLPNQTLYWRIRSSYDKKTWNAWQIFSSPLTCGPVGVYSGLLRSVANSLLNTATMANGASPLTQSGMTTLIDVASSVVHAGTSSVLTYSAGSVDPGAYGLWYVYAIDNARVGGAVTYIATQDKADLSSQDGAIYFGSITTVNTGGGTGGGGIFCGIFGALVDMYDGGQKNIAEILKGDRIRGADGGLETAQHRARMIPNQPCFTLVAENRAVLSGASSAHRLRLASGGFPEALRTVDRRSDPLSRRADCREGTGIHRQPLRF